MFPKPIENTNILTQSVYKTALPIVLILWLLPLIAVALTSVRSGGDLISGNYWGWPTSFDLYENYTSVFKNTPLAQYMWNSFRVTIPTVFGAVALSCMTGFALAVYNFKGNILIFFLFIAGNFVPFQILMVPVRDLSVQMGVYNSVWALILFHIAFQAGFCTNQIQNQVQINHA